MLVCLTFLFSFKLSESTSKALEDLCFLSCITSFATYYTTTMKVSEPKDPVSLLSEEDTTMIKRASCDGNLDPGGLPIRPDTGFGDQRYAVVFLRSL